MLEVPLPLAWVEDEDRLVFGRVEDFAQVGFDRTIEPHEVEVDAAVDLFLEGAAELVEHVEMILLFGFRGLDSVDDAESSVFFQANVVCTV